MKKILLLFFLGISHLVSAQSDSLFKQLNTQITYCETVSKNSYIALAKLGLDDLKQSKEVISIWENACNNIEPVYRIKLLLAIYENQAVDSLFLDTKWQEPFSTYRHKIRNADKERHGSYEYYKAYFGYVPLNSALDSLTKEIALIILEREDLNSTERLIVYFYSNQFSRFDELLEKTNNPLKKSIEEDLKKRSAISPVDHYAQVASTIYLGSWQKQSPSAYSISLKTGFEYQNWRYNISLSANYFNLNGPIEVKHDKLVKEIDDKFMISFGIEVVKPIYIQDNGRFGIFAAFNPMVTSLTIPGQAKEQEDKDAITGLILESGFIFNWKVANYRHMGVSLKHQYLNLSLDRKVLNNFQGHGLSLGLVIGLRNKRQSIDD